MKSRYRKAVFIVVYAKTKKGIRYLLLKRRLHWVGWEFPKGGVRFLETKERAVIRELKEETGLKPITIKKFDFHGKYNYSKTLPDRKGFIGQSFSLYSAEVKKSKIKISRREHSEYRWVSFNMALKMLRWENQKKSLMIVNQFLMRN